MKTFFYTVSSPNCAEDCRYTICSKRYLSQLQGQKNGGVYLPLEGPIAYGKQPAQPLPKRGDIVILFAQNSKDLESMNSCCDCFEGMKKVLVFADSRGIDGSMYHKLSPRYITQASRAIEELDQVVKRMKTPINSMS